MYEIRETRIGGAYVSYSMKNPCEDQVFGFDASTLVDALRFNSLFDACAEYVEPGYHCSVFTITRYRIMTHLITGIIQSLQLIIKLDHVSAFTSILHFSTSLGVVWSLHIISIAPLFVAAGVLPFL